MMLFWLISPALASTYELDPSADLQGIFDSLAAGDEVVLADGVYRISSTLGLREKTGTELSPIRIRAAEEAAPVIQLGPDPSSGQYSGRVFTIENSLWVEVDGITLQGDPAAATGDTQFGGLHINTSSNISWRNGGVRETPGTGVYVSGDASNITIEHTELSRLYKGHGIYVGCSDASCLTTGLVLKQNLIHDVLAEDTDAIALNHGTSGAIVQDNVIYNITHRGVFLGSTEGGDPNIVESNAIWNLGHVGIYIQGAVLVRNNIVFNTGDSGIVTRDPGRDTLENIIITYNTVVDNDDWSVDLEGWDESAGNVLANNALCNPLSYGVYMEKVVPDGTDPAEVPTPGTVARNYVCGLVDGLSEDLGEVVASGGYGDFSNVELWDFYPTVESFLVDAADPSGAYWPPEVDFNGVPREGDKPDVGAYEWDGEGNPGWPIQEDFKDFEIEEVTVSESVESGCCKDGGKSSEAGFLLAPLLGLGAGIRRRRRDRSLS